MTDYHIPRRELILDVLNRSAIWVLILGAVITGATSHQAKAFTMLYIFGALVLVLCSGLLVHAVLRLAGKKQPETNMRKAALQFPLELILLAFLILCTYFGFSVKGYGGAQGLVDGDVSSRRVACGFLGLVASGAQLIHAPTAMVNCLKAKHAEQDEREKQNSDAAARVV